jgi:hypothetical protein
VEAFVHATSVIAPHRLFNALPRLAPWTDALVADAGPATLVGLAAAFVDSDAATPGFLQALYEQAVVLAPSCSVHELAQLLLCLVEGIRALTQRGEALPPSLIPDLRDALEVDFGPRCIGRLGSTLVAPDCGSVLLTATAAHPGTAAADDAATLFYAATAIAGPREGRLDLYEACARRIYSMGCSTGIPDLDAAGVAKSLIALAAAWGTCTSAVPGVAPFTAPALRDALTAVAMGLNWEAVPATAALDAAYAAALIGVRDDGFFAALSARALRGKEAILSNAAAREKLISLSRVLEPDRYSRTAADA